MRINSEFQLLLAGEGMPTQACETFAALALERGWALRFEAAPEVQAGPCDLVVAMFGRWRADAARPRPRGVLWLTLDSDPAVSESWPALEREVLQPWPCSTQELLTCVLTLLASEPLSLDASTRMAMHRGHGAKLTPKECRILELLLAHVGRAVAREVLEAALHAWGQEFESNTLEVHVHRLRRKLPHAGIRVVRGYGYVLLTDL